ncbi:MAG: hypothetical protein ABSH06_23530 [Thermodesulfobacteriota bacterium]
MKIKSSSNQLLNFFSKISERFINRFLTIDINRFINDSNYALKMFLNSYAFARAGAPNGYKIAAIKSVSSLESSDSNDTTLWKAFQHFYGGKLNINMNPCADPKIFNLNFSSIARMISNGDFSNAFSQLQLRGIGPKIRSLFIRDIAYLTKVDRSSSFDIKQYLYAQPIDTWVRQTIDLLDFETPLAEVPFDNCYLLNRDDFGRALKLTSMCIGSGTSPLRVNMGIWYFCSQVVADATRLQSLLKANSVNALEKEMDYMKGFLMLTFNP